MNSDTQRYNGFTENREREEAEKKGRKNFSGNYRVEILHRPHRAILVFLTDLVVQVPDRERSGSYR